MENIKPKPCPFCGGEAVVISKAIRNQFIQYQIMCRECKCTTQMCHMSNIYTDNHQAVEILTAIWNTRYEP